MRSRTNTRLRFQLILLLAVTAWSSGVAAATPDPAARIGTVRQINQFLRDGNRDAALPLCRRYAAAYPDDAVMLYNLACLENTVGDRERAEPAYAAALLAGFSRLGAAVRDPDLQGPLHDLIVARNAAETARLAAQAHRQALSLDYDVWSEPRDLIPHGPPAGENAAEPSTAQLRLRWRKSGLELEVTADRDWARPLSTGGAAPWNGGPSLMLTVCIPDGRSAWESANSYLFAFGLGAKGNAGGMYLATQGHWQQVSELAPKIKVDQAERLQLTALIPWQSIMPYGPVVDTPLGVNATLSVPGGPVRRLASLVETTDTLNPVAELRRYARLDFRTDSIDTDLFVGRLDDSLSSDQPLNLDLVVVSRQAGSATLALNFMDQAGRTVLPKGPITGRIALREGTTRISRQADFRSLRTGGYVLQAELTYPDSTRLKWGAAVLQLPATWQEPYTGELSLVPLAEQPTVRFLLDEIAAAVADHRPRRSPGPIVTTLTDLDRMFADVQENGTILPDKGSFVMVYPGPLGEDRLCRLYLPAGRQYADGLNPVLVLGHGRGQEARLAARIGRNYEYGTRKPTLLGGDDNQFPIYLVPELRPDPAHPEDSLLAEAEACRRWARGYFASRTVSLVGVDALGATALQMARSAPTTCRTMLVFAGAGLDPWPQASGEFVRQRLGPPPPALSVTWLDFSSLTARQGQAPLILQALKDLGYEIASEQDVPGGLNQSQVADRVVQWAEGLR